MKSRTWMWMTVLCLFAALAVPVGTAAQDNPSQDHKPKHKQYKLIDVGTFGGSASYFTFFQEPINSAGTIVGGADSSIADPYFPNCFNLDCFSSHAFQLNEGVMTDLGTLPGGYSSFAEWVNDRGWIVGISQNGLIDPVFGTPETHGVLWRNGEVLDLGTLGGTQSTAFGLNNRGQVTGLAFNAIPDPFSFAGPGGTQVRAYLWQNGAMQDIGTLGGPDAFGQYINERGQVVGFSYINYIPNPSTGVPTVDPFLWQNGQMQDLGSLGGTFGQVGIVSNQGDVVATMNLAGDVYVHGFIWHHGSLIDPGTFGGHNASANWVNGAGEVVGVADLPGGQLHDAFLWRKGNLMDLGNLGVTSVAYGINSQRQVVGASRIDATPGNARAFLWENGGPMLDLNTLVPSGSGLTLVYAVYINDRGWIAGLGAPAGCQPPNVESCGHAYVLIPDGDCDSECEGRIAASQNNAAPAQNAATIKQGNESPVSPVNQLRNRLMPRYDIPSQPAAPRD